MAIALAAAVALSGCGGGEPPAAGPGAGGPAGPVPVGVVTLQPRTFQYEREVSGRVAASLVAEVRPQVSGILTKRLFNEGTMVRAGQPLYRIEDATYRATERSAQAALARALAAQATAQANARRADSLIKIDAVSRQDHEVAQAQLRQADADVKVAEAALTNAGVQLGYARVTAPITGQIGRSAVTVGALVTAAQPTALATIQQLDPVYVDVTQSESDFLNLRAQFAADARSKARDVPVRVILANGQDHARPGRVAFAESTVDPNTGGRILRIVVPNPDRVLLPGSYVRAIVGVGSRTDTLLVPQRGVTRDPRGNATVMVVGAGNKVEARAVQLGPSAGDQWIVEGGLVAGDRVIVEGVQKIAPGAPVQPTEVSPSLAATATPVGATAASPAAAGSRR